MIKTENLSYQYPDQNDLIFPNLNVENEDALLILGDSGCGKTTLLHLLAGLLKAKSGDIFFDEENITSYSAAKMDLFRGQHIGLVYQKSYFIESLSVRDNLRISPFAPDLEKAESLAEQLNISHLLSKMPKQLSVGEQQRMSIARALMTQPKLVLADEPTSALDNSNCSRVIDLLLTHSKQSKAALIIVTHDERLKSEIQNQVQLAPLKSEVQS